MSIALRFPGQTAGVAPMAEKPRPHAGGTAESGAERDSVQQPTAPAAVVEVVGGVRLVGPYLGTGRMPRQPSCFHPSRAQWQLQGYSQTEQVNGRRPTELLPPAAPPIVVGLAVLKGRQRRRRQEPSGRRRQGCGSRRGSA